MNADRRCLRSGAWAGILAGATIVVFYLVVDLVRGEPLATPLFLADGVFGVEAVRLPVLQVVLFTALHFAVFAVLGLLACVLTELTPIPRTVLVGALYGLFIQSLLFYLALVVSGVPIVEAPDWPIVFFGNVIAGIVLMLSLRRALGGDGGEKGRERTGEFRTVVSEGIIAGLLGAAVVAAWFFVLDMASGRPLFTPAALGSAMLYGVAAADAVIVSPGTVLGYTVYHIAAFTFIGIVASALITQAEKFPPLIFGLFILFVVFETFVVFLTALLGVWIMEELAWWAILVGNLLAAISMGLYLRSRHPELGERLREEALWGVSQPPAP